LLRAGLVRTRRAPAGIVALSTLESLIAMSNLDLSKPANTLQSENL
jgi:hypothetical protein